MSIEFKDDIKYEFNDLRDDELKKLDEFDEWVNKMKNNKN